MSGGRQGRRKSVSALDSGLMSDSATTWLERFRPYQRRFEIGFWVAVLTLQVAFNSVVTWLDLGRGGLGRPFWQPLAWEISSNLAVGLLVPAIVAFERRFPLRGDT